MASHQVIVKTSGDGKFTQEVTAGPHRIITDEPVSLGGDDTGMAPYDLLMAALGSCTSMTIKMYADRKGWPLEGLEIHLTHKKTPSGDHFTRNILIKGDKLDEDQRARLIEIANKCPVHKTLEGGGTIIETREIKPPDSGTGPAPRTPHGPVP